MRPIILEKGEIWRLRNFIAQVPKICNCGQCEICKKRKIIEARLREKMLNETAFEGKIIFEEENFQRLVDLIDETYKRHFCEHCMYVWTCEICTAREWLKLRLLALTS